MRIAVPEASFTRSAVTGSLAARSFATSAVALSRLLKLPTLTT